MRHDWRQEPEARGGCQCGAVRYEIAAGPAKSTVCHCRMCQRATGNAFAPLYEVAVSAVTWFGEPARWASSSAAERGFCGICGTPLFYQQTSNATIELMAPTLAPGFDYRPIANHGTESRVRWLAGLNALPDIDTPPATEAAILSHQSPEAC